MTKIEPSQVTILREWRPDIEQAKGLAISLVVFGHLVARQDPAGVHWYEPLRRAVYSFHMPFFLYLSGLVSVHSGFLQQRRASFCRLAVARAKRLLLPFFGLGVLIVLGKCAAMGLVHVDNAPASLEAGLLALVWDTGNSPALSIWYLFVLFVVSLVCLALLDGRAERLPWLLAGALVLFWVKLPSYIYLDRVGMFAPFFLMGAAAGFAGARWEAWMDQVWPWALAGFAVALAIIAALPTGGMLTQKIILLLAGTGSLQAIHGSLRQLRYPPLQQALSLLGRYSFMIYLFNTLCIGLVKAILLLGWSWDGANFLPFAAMLMGAGLMGPMALKRYAFRHIKRLDRLTD
jgi:fucose 4-O-acetylase-like acetyltransferase